MSDINTRLKESLSALMDDAADELEVQRTLKAVSEDNELRETWQRYQLARTAMRGETTAIKMDLSASVAAAIADEPSHNMTAERPTGQLFKTLSRVAIAASVTVAVVLGVQQYSQTDGTAGTQVIADGSETSAPLPSPFDTPIPTRTVSDTDEAQTEPSYELDEESKRQLEQKLDELVESEPESKPDEENGE